MQQTQPRRRWSLSERMNGHYWRIARRRRHLGFLSRIFREGLVISPLQYEMAITDLTRLRQAVEGVQKFYSTLDPESMKLFQPWGAIAKLTHFETQVSELLLWVVAMQEANAEKQVLTRVHLHLLVRHLFPGLLISFEDLVSQLSALPQKAGR